MTFGEFRKLKGPIMLRTSAQDGSYVHYRYLEHIEPKGSKLVKVRERAWVGIDVRENGNELALHMVNEPYELDPSLSIDRRGVTEADITSVQVGKQGVIKDILS